MIKSNSSDNPYRHFPLRQFWKAGVEQDGKLNNIWKPKFAVTKDCLISTAGSCFAQHISTHIKNHDYQWIQSEIAPDGMSEQEQRAAGYGVFSFRTGNIYTAALLRQWVEWAFGQSQPSKEIFLGEDGRIHDPFRPIVPQQGYETADELYASRLATIKAIRTCLIRTDIFIFTLGLTECWRNNLGEVYPVCPGTVQGTYNDAKHKFHNQDYNEIHDDLHEVMRIISRHNDKIKYIFTVSPVPLTATAVDEHVLCSTVYSKSVLRAVAGHLHSTYGNVDYFPSYEIVANPFSEDRHYEKNRRSVRPDAVAKVMSIFLNAIGAFDNRAYPTSVSGQSAHIQADDHAEIICEEALLEQAISAVPIRPRVMLLGDSHMAKMLAAANRMSVPAIGGGVMWGSQWHNLEFVLHPEEFFKTHSAGSQARWTTFLSQMRIAEWTDGGPVLVTNIGIHSHAIPHDFVDPNQTLDEFNSSHPKYCLIRRKFEQLRSRHIELLKSFRDKGFRVICITDPPSQDDVWKSFAAVDLVISDVLQHNGLTVFNARKWLSERGGFTAEYKGEDWVHGSDVYYDRVLEFILRELVVAAPCIMSASSPGGVDKIRWLSRLRGICSR